MSKISLPTVISLLLIKHEAFIKILEYKNSCFYWSARNSPRNFTKQDKGWCFSTFSICDSPYEDCNHPGSVKNLTVTSVVLPVDSLGLAVVI